MLRQRTAAHGGGDGDGATGVDRRDSSAMGVPACGRAPHGPVLRAPEPVGALLRRAGRLVRHGAGQPALGLRLATDTAGPGQDRPAGCGGYTVTSDPAVKIADTGLASLRNRQSAP